MNKEQVKGRVVELKGKAKEAVGVLVDDKSLQVEGNVQKNLGKLEAGFGDLKQELKNKL
ncbi:CsbD family protein [Methylomonas koyamae]|uniref:CsbD family protein n=1 Tax=Methylomonas koyamae TaxID=702114 RepID=UPI00112E8B6F|nr:CsbD family protein [Methylomonas koyamae]TPQ26228.1 CsbD family protein [Methylomonas koyamae]